MSTLIIIICIILYFGSDVFDNVSDGAIVQSLKDSGYTPKEIADETGMDISDVLKEWGGNPN